MALITQAFVLGAGLGTRLRPLTDDLPKPLIPIFQKPLITFAFDHLIDAGLSSFVVNTHRLPEAFARTFAAGHYGDTSVKLVNEPVLLGTGGGIKNVESLLGEKPFIVYSGDILTDVDFGAIIDEHFRAKNDVTLGLRRNTGLGSGVAVRDKRIIAISKDSNSRDNFDYANISVWSPGIFARIPAGQELSFIPIVVKWIAEGGRIGGVALDDGEWFNIGSRSEYLNVHRKISEGWTPYYIKAPDWPARVAADSIVDPTAELHGCTVIGSGCRVGAGAILEDTIVWPGSQIASGSKLFGCIVRSHKNVSGIHRDSDI